MAPDNRGRKRDSLLNPLNWVKRSRSSSSAAREDPSTTSQTDDTSRLKVFLKPSTSDRPSIAPSLLPSQSSDLWSQAFRKANDTTQKWLEEQGLDLHSLEGKQVQTQVKEIISLMKSRELSEDTSKPLKIEIANRKIIVREYLADAIAFVTMVGDAAIVFAPPQASVPWAVAKAIMKIPVKNIEQKAALFGTIEWFIRITRRGQIYESLYTTETTDEGAVSNLHNALLELYTAAIELVARFDVMAKKGAFKEILSVVLSPNYATDLVSNLRKKEESVDSEIRCCNASRSAVSSEKMKVQIENLRKQLVQLSSPLPRIDDSVSSLLEKVNKRELEEMMSFISSEMFGKSHAAVTDTRIENTGNWLLANRDFRAWQDIPSSSAVFLLKGAGGTGKTYLTSKVIDHVKSNLEKFPHHEGFAYFYCSRSGSSMQQPLVVLRSFIRQLSGKAFDDSDEIQSSILQRCSKAKKEMRELSYKDCEELILESLNLYSKTTIVLDALDESDIATYNLAKCLIQMMEKSERPVKIFISSRPDREYLEEVFKDKFLITVDASNQHDDIQIYLEDKLYSTEKFKRRKPEIQDVIKRIFNTKGRGMFRWVYLQVKSLEMCVSDDAVHNWTQKLPRDLTEAYDQLWENIRERDESDVALAERAIKWVLCSIRPLEPNEFLEAIQYSFKESTIVRKEQQSQQQILSLCQDLLMIDEERGVWMLPHASVAEYFESKGWTRWECDAFASKVCLGYLENFQVDGPFESVTFANYVRWYWYRHVERYDGWLGVNTDEEAADSNLVEALKRFLGSPDESSDSYQRWSKSFYTDTFEPTNFALFAVCNYGFYYILRDWWLGGKITEEMALQQNVNGQNSLTLAAGSNCDPICRHLAGLIDVMHPDASRHAGALVAAFESGNYDILKWLVMEADADVNFPFRGRLGELTAAQLAAIHFPDLLQWMVDHDAVDLEKENNESSHVGNILIAAAFYGNIESIRILLKAGANVNAAVKNGNYGSPLVAAVGGVYKEDHVEMVKTLLDSGADPNLHLIGGMHGGVLEALMMNTFTDEYSENLVRKIQHMLLEVGADPADLLERGGHGSALAAAAFYGRKDNLRVMIDRVGTERAISTLSQSRHPDNQRFYSEVRFRRQDTAIYLASEVGVSKHILDTIGLE